VPPEEALSVLFVGNSLTYTNDLPGILEMLLESADVGPLYIRSVAYGNFGLEDHWANGTAQATIRRGGWDVVVLQQGPSATEGRPSLLAYSAKFAAIADSIGARTALYMVWPSSDRLFDFNGVSDSYATAARNVGGLLFPAGEAWRAAWARDSNLVLYGPDGFHPSLLGSYVAALVIFGQLASQSPVELPDSFSWEGLELTSRQARLLQDAAADANAAFALP
jgi:hypothetical protein